MTHITDLRTQYAEMVGRIFDNDPDLLSDMLNVDSRADAVQMSKDEYDDHVEYGDELLFAEQWNSGQPRT